LKRLQERRFAPLFVILAAILWGVDGIVLRPSLYTLPVILVVMIESSAAALIMTPFFINQFPKLKQLNYKEWGSLIGVAVLGGAVGTLAITKALFYVEYINLSVVVLIQKLQPVFAIALAALLLKERLPKIFIKWAVVALIGAYFMTFGAHIPRLNASDKTLLAAGFALLATISFASSTVLSKRLLRKIDFHFATYLRFLVTAILMILLAVSTQKIEFVHQVTRHQWMIFLFIVLFTGAPAIFLYYFGLRQIPASVSTICELAFPISAILLEYVLYKKYLSLAQWLGTIVLLYSIVKISSMVNFWKD
jgi:drug/metabolite transporter (DMT)-like permease